MPKQEMQLRFDYDSLPEENRSFVLERTERIRILARLTATGIVQIGQYLTEVKAILAHGRFLEWIEREFAWSERSSRNFMTVYECFKTANFADLEIDVSALYLDRGPVHAGAGANGDPAARGKGRADRLGRDAGHAGSLRRNRRGARQRGELGRSDRIAAGA